MKICSPTFFSSIATALTVALLSSCGSKEPEPDHDANGTVYDGDENAESGSLSALIESAGSGVSQNLESFLDGADSTELQQPPVSSKADLHSTGIEKSAGLVEPSVARLVSDVGTASPEASLEAYKAEKALANLEESAISQQREAAKLRESIERKDRTIASLTKLNKDLVSEVNRLKGGNDYVTPDPVTTIGESPSPQTKLLGLKSEIKNLRGNLLIKSNEIQDLRLRNDSLEERISVLEINPSKKFTPLRVSPSVESLITKNLSAPSNDPVLDEVAVKETPLPIGGCNLQFDAVVTALNGKNKEAFYTEFFIIDEDIEKVLRVGGIKLEEYSGTVSSAEKIDSYAELWAKARKNSFLYPKVQKNIRSLLLKIVEAGQGYRVRTDINGAATLENLPPGKFFVVGTASLGTVGVTWSVPIQLKPGTNKLSLTLANAAWSL
ncbi:hypothetical protein OAK38_01125 [Verrucomicrobia bacterium]|nr:hypothetical protein [Verrucomicrobiota bacterium]